MLERSFTRLTPTYDEGDKMLQEYWFLPKILDRKYTLIEKLSVWFLGDTYIDHKGTLRLKDYAVYSYFNTQGFSRSVPYRIGGKYSREEHRRFERFGIVLKTPYAKKIFERQTRPLRAEALSKRARKNDRNS